MPNDYYNRVTDYIPGAAVRSSDVDAELDAVVAGFDKLGDPTKLGNGASLVGVDTGTTNIYIYSNGGTSTIVNGQLITFVPLNTSTGPSVVAYNGGTQYPVVRNDGTPTQAGDFVEGVPLLMIWDAANSRWVLIGSTAAQLSAQFRPGVIDTALTAYTLSGSDEGKVINFTSGSAVSVTAPSDATENLPIGFISHLHQNGGGKVTIVPAGGVTIRRSNSLNTRVQYSSLSIIKIAANTFKVIGDQEV